MSLSWGTLIYFINVSAVTTTKYKSDRKREKEKEVQMEERLPVYLSRVTSQVQQVQGKP